MRYDEDGDFLEDPERRCLYVDYYFQQQVIQSVLALTQSLRQHQPHQPQIMLHDLVDNIFYKVNAIVQAAGTNYVLPSRNWIRLQICLIYGENSSIIRIGSNGYLNSLLFDAANPYEVRGQGSIKRFIPCLRQLSSATASLDRN